MTGVHEYEVSRTQHMLDGRRITLADLVHYRLVAPGAELVFHRPRLGETYVAVVTDTGKVRLDSGEEFASSSRAASACLGGAPGGDGWYMWRVGGPDGPRLDDLRQELLDQAADEDTTVQVRSSEVQRRHGFLRESRALADEGSARAVTVRELIGMWGARGRGTRINQQIEADLSNHGLTTSPSFRKVTLDASVTLAKASVEAPEGEPIADAVVVDDVEEFDVGLTVGNLPSALGGVEAVAPDATFEEAITKMLLNDYSQLAVLTKSQVLGGAVTWKSIARTRHARPGAKLTDAVIRPHVVHYDQDLIDVLPVLSEDDFVLVRDDADAVAGIVTTSDVASAYGDMATPFFLIGEIDQHLRWVITRSFTIEEVVACCYPTGNRRIRSFDDLTFGNYQRVLEDTNNWEKLGWPFDRAVVVSRLDEIRTVRNDVMHFNPDPLPHDAVNQLRHFLRLLRELTG